MPKKPKSLFPDLGRIECVEWIDAYGPEGWHEKEKLPVPAVIFSVGWISHEGPDSLTITSHKDPMDNMHHADITIPKVCIKKRRRVG